MTTGTLRPCLPEGLEEALVRHDNLTALLGQLAEGGDDPQLIRTFAALLELSEGIGDDLRAIVNMPEKPAGGSS